ncbi:MAG: PKD domain-containing protein [Candidatus Cloacimonetes bacterium]|nr:PKD domain-containing protein [Candidatus Cloacimonadota bacterium]
MENDINAEFFIPLIWQGNGTWPSPGYSTRGSLYGVGGIPHSQWNGFEEIVGGNSTTMYSYYINMYNQLEHGGSPLAMETGFSFSPTGDLRVQVDVELTSNITTTNNKIVYIIKWHQTNDYFCTVVRYEYENFGLTTVGETGTFSHDFPMNAAWDIEDLTAVAMVQTYSGNHQILQASQSGFTGIIADFTALDVNGFTPFTAQFSDLSSGSITSWEWDFQNDGIIDSYEQNPAWLYSEEGIYSVSLTVSDETGRTTETILKENYIEIYPPLDYGDVDDNDAVEAFDAALVLQYFCEIVPTGTTLPWEEWRIETADVDDNGSVEAYDASLILQYSVGLITEFPVE